jgi:hypothetical protein
LRAGEQGLVSQSADFVDVDLIARRNNVKTCENFFSLWPSDCLDGFEELDERLRVLSAEMLVMNATATLFVTDMKGCNFQYPAIQVKSFNATEQLVSHGFSEAFPKMAMWNKSRYTRISDILRLCLAHRYRMSYLDSDVHFLQVF